MSCSVVYWSEATSEPPKVVRTPGVFNILTSKCPSRHNGVHFFDIRTSKSGANMWCFVHFDLEMCFAPQRRALFRHLNFQKWSDNGVFCTFWLGNVLRATTACTFSTSQLPKVVRRWGVLYILTWKCTLRHNGVHFFNISTSKSGPRMVCFVPFWVGNVLRATTACNFSSLIWPAGSAPAALASLLFDPPEPQIIGKTQWIATFLPFRASPSSFLLIFLFSLPLPCSAFHLSILSEVWLLNFLRQYMLESYIIINHLQKIYPLEINTAMENGPFSSMFYQSWWFSIAMFVFERVYHHTEVSWNGSTPKSSKSLDRLRIETYRNPWWLEDLLICRTHLIILVGW